MARNARQTDLSRIEENRSNPALTPAIPPVDLDLLGLSRSERKLREVVLATLEQAKESGMAENTDALKFLENIRGMATELSNGIRELKRDPAFGQKHLELLDRHIMRPVEALIKIHEDGVQRMQEIQRQSRNAG